MRIADGAEPVLRIGPDRFQEQQEDGLFWGVPRRHFHVSSREVRLDSTVACKLDWNFEEEHNGAANINAIAQTVTVDGEELTIWPGGICSHIDADSILRQSDRMDTPTSS